MTAASQKPGEPDDFAALFALAVREHRAGRLAQAEAAYRRILALRPDAAEAYNNLGVVLKNLGKRQQAKAHYLQAVALKPGYAEAYNNLGNLLLDDGQLDEAAARYEQALAVQPDFAEAHCNLGGALWRQGKLDQAAARVEQALALRPGYPEALNTLGMVLWQQGKPVEALARCERALAIRPAYVDALKNLGIILRSLGRLDEAVARYEQALALRPEAAETHYNLGNALKEQGKVDAAVARFEQAVALRPDYAEALKNLGLTLLEQRKLNPARQAVERLVALRPDDPEAQLCLATCYLIAEDYERGWPAYEARLRRPGHLPSISLPRWSGEPLAGRSLLLLAEQGLGDTLQFLRYARLLKQRGAKVVLAAPAPLGRLLAGHPDVDELFIFGSSNVFPPCDFYLPLLSAAGALGTTRSSIPCQVPYVSADPALTEKWRDEMAAIDGFKIAIAWQGARDYRHDHWRSIPLSQFAPLARLPGVRLVSLQKGFGSEQIAAVEFPVLDLSDRLDEASGPFMDTAAVMQSVDLVVAPDTVMTHLAGALGAPVWAALPYSPDWRWLLDRDDTPWYPTMRLFRQTKLGQWSDVFERMAAAVQARRSQIGAI